MKWTRQGMEPWDGQVFGLPKPDEDTPGKGRETEINGWRVRMMPAQRLSRFQPKPFDVMVEQPDGSWKRVGPQVETYKEAYALASEEIYGISRQRYLEELAALPVGRRMTVPFSISRQLEAYKLQRRLTDRKFVTARTTGGMMVIERVALQATDWTERKMEIEPGETPKAAIARLPLGWHIDLTELGIPRARAHHLSYELNLKLATRTKNGHVLAFKVANKKQPAEAEDEL